MPALADLSAGRSTNQAMAVKILQAQAVNQVLGGVVVTPWNVDELPDEWLDAFQMFAKDLKDMVAQRQEAERVKARLKKKR